MRLYLIRSYCQSGVWSNNAAAVKYGGSFLVGSGAYRACEAPNIRTGKCICPAGYTARLASMGGWYSYSPWDAFLWGYICEM